MIRMAWLVMACVVLGGCRDSNSPVGTWKPSVEQTMAHAGVSMPAGMKKAIEDTKGDFGTVTLKLHADHTFTMQSQSSVGGSVQSSSMTNGQWEQRGEHVVLTMDAPKMPSDAPEPRSLPFMELRFVEGKMISQSAGPAMVFVRS